MIFDFLGKLTHQSSVLKEKIIQNNEPYLLDVKIILAGLLDQIRLAKTSDTLVLMINKTYFFSIIYIFQILFANIHAQPSNTTSN